MEPWRWDHPAWVLSLCSLLSFRGTHLHPLPSPRACPECRVTSGYYIPHKYWVSDAGEKEKLIETFKARMG